MGKAVLTIVAGPNQGDTVSIDWESADYSVDTFPRAKPH